jgi:hypothetical protein
MVADLLRGFVHDDWVQDVDFATLERSGDGYVTDDLRERLDHIVWWVRLGRECLYVYLMIEFQSSVDPFMAVRVLLPGRMPGVDFDNLNENACRAG